MRCQLIAVAVACVVLLEVSVLAVDSKKARFVGGTIATIQAESEGPFLTSDERTMKFVGNKGGIEIPYAAVDELEYGQKAGRRVGAAVVINPLFLFSKKRKHYLTVSYKDADGKDQAVVFELGKDIVRTTLTIIETRSGKKITFQDEEARKAGKGGGD